MITFIERSDKEAIVGDHIRYTYNDVLKHVKALAEKLGHVEGERIMVFSENRVEWIFALYAAWRQKAAVVPVDIMSTQEDVDYIMDDCRPCAVFCSRDKSDMMHMAAKNNRQEPEILVFEDLVIDAESHEPDDFAVTDDASTALILYTSGTTGNPKGVMLSFGNLFANLDAVCNDVPIFTARDRVMMLLPLHHILPLVGTIVAPFFSKGTIIINPSLGSDNLISTLHQHKVTMMIGVPRLYQVIYKGLHEKIRQNLLARLFLWLSRRIRSTAFSRKLFGTVHKKFGGAIRYLVCGGAPIEAEIVAFFRDLGFELLEGYGMTETAPMITFTRPGKIKPGVPGQLLPGVSVRFVDNEIVVSGKNVMKGYFKKPEETAEVLQDGWLATGDLGFLDDEGYLHITGRKKEIIVLPNGKNINPEEIEQKILKQSSVIREAGVFMKEGVLQAVVVPDFKKAGEEGIGNLDDHIRWQVIDKTNHSLAAYKKVLRFHTTSEELPRTRLGKVKRYLLPEMTIRKEKEAVREPDLKEYKILKKFLEQETRQQVHPSDHLELDLAIDSLGKVSLSAFIETSFGVHIHESELSEFLSIAALSEFLHEKKTRLNSEGISWSEILKEKVNLNLRKPVFTQQMLKTTIKLILKSFMRIRTRGLENLPDNPCIIAPNHQSILDGFLVVSLLQRRHKRNTYIYAKEKHFRNPILKFMADRNNVILVDVNKDLKHSIQKLAEVLKKGKNLLIFPEGTRSLTGKLGDYKQTFAILSQELNIPVVPVAICGSYDVLPSGSRFPRLFRTVRVDFLQPVQPGTGTYESMSNHIQQIVSQHMGGLC